MSYQCKICRKRSYSEYCFMHKPKKAFKTHSQPARANVERKTSSKPPEAPKCPAGALKRPKRPKAKDRKQLVKELDAVFSEYIRRSKPPVCVTCNKTDDWRNLQNGHYYSRDKIPTRWHEDNCHPQCVACNVFKRGNYTEYALFMVNRYGVAYMEELRTLAKSCAKIPTSRLQEMIDEYKVKLTQL